jgi:hypothetical protein
LPLLLPPCAPTPAHECPRHPHLEMPLLLLLVLAPAAVVLRQCLLLLVMPVQAALG